MYGIDRVLPKAKLANLGLDDMTSTVGQIKYRIEVPIDVWTSENFAPRTVEMIRQNEFRQPIEIPINEGALYIHLQRLNNFRFTGVNGRCLEILDVYISSADPQAKDIWIDIYNQISLVGYGQVWFGIWVENARDLL